MNWDQIEGKWMQFRGSVKQKWGELTDGDLDYIRGKQDQLIGKLQERYGIAREEAKRRVDEWLKSYHEEEAFSGSGAGTKHTGRRR
ncbi:MAG TPA: CsbD family protein [Bryobacteraceae bacterium]|nr:CsbD family protein [Bryobacteraceae bacterium]